MARKQVRSSSTVVGTLVHLSASEILRLPKPRAGFETFCPQLIELAEKEPSLRPKGFDADAATRELQEYLALNTAVAEAEKQLALAQETRLYHASNLWVLMLGIYSRARTESKNDADIMYAVAAFEAFMKARPQKKRSGSTTAPASTATTIAPSPTTPSTSASSPVNTSAASASSSQNGGSSTT